MGTEAYRRATRNGVANAHIQALRGMVEPVARPAATNQQYQYDAFGNLNQITTDGSAQTISIDSATNRLLAPATYDPAGNMTAWGGYTYTYDPLNAMTVLTGGTLNKAYTYDAQGERVSFKDVPSTTTTYSLRGLDGKVLREYSYNGSSWSWSKDLVYRQGQLLAAIDSTGTKHFTLDHLGSPRLITDGSRNIVEYHAYWGYGAEIDTACGSERMKFTGHERDNQCSAGMLDYMHARYYSPTIGRFLSVDSGRDQSSRSPQSWHLYAYARNNPLLFVDPGGESSLLFDGVSHTVELRAHDGTLVGRWPAYNNVQLTNPAGRWENGTYPMLDTFAPHMHPNDPEADTAAGRFGTNGILRAESFIETNGVSRVGMGLHAGREGVTDEAGRRGPAYATDGCIRTTGGAMTTIVQTMATDPLTSITVTNNKPPLPPRAPAARPTPPPERDNRPTEDPVEHPRT